MTNRKTIFTAIIVSVMAILSACGKTATVQSSSVMANNPIEDTSVITTTEHSTTTEYTTTITTATTTTTTECTTTEFTTTEDTTTTTIQDTTTTPWYYSYYDITTNTDSVQTTTQCDDYKDYNSYYTGLTDAEFNMIASVVQVEADSGSLEFKEYIVGIIYNRIYSNSFPNSVYGVLTQSGQFNSISNYYNGNVSVDDDTRLAVARIFAGYDSYILSNLSGAVSYCNPYLTDSSWFDNNMLCTFQCSEHINGINWVHNFYALY